MTIDFVMPSLGADMESGTVTQWMIEAGDTVARGDIVAIVETDKADIDIEVWDSGTVAEILVPTGEEVPVGTPLARLEVASVATGASPTASTSRRPSAAQDEPTTDLPSLSGPPGQVRSGTAPARPLAPQTLRSDPAVMPQVGSGAGFGARIVASPLARRLAGERGIDLMAVNGTGPGGAVVAADLADVGPVPAAADHAERAVDPEDRGRSGGARMRRAIAELLTRSKREIPHYYLATDVDLEAMFCRLSTLNADRSVSDRILPAAVLLKAVAVAAAGHDVLNGFWVDDGFRPSERVHLGVAVSLRGGGLVAPAIHDADQLTVDELMAGLRDLVGRARSGRLRGSEMTDPTLTVSNLGDRGVDLVHGVVYPPQVSLVGIGRISTRPAVVDDVVRPRRQVTFSLAADHRASDGQVGARFLNTIDRLLQKPEALEQ